jgi:hypothetical protein
MRRNSSKKRKIFFYECVLEFYLATNHQRVCITKLLKSLYPSIQTTVIHSNKIYTYSKFLFPAPLLLENRSQYEPAAVRHVLFM